MITITAAPTRTIEPRVAFEICQWPIYSIYWELFWRTQQKKSSPEELRAKKGRVKCVQLWRREREIAPKNDVLFMHCTTKHPERSLAIANVIY